MAQADPCPLHPTGPGPVGRRPDPLSTLDLLLKSRSAVSVLWLIDAPLDPLSLAPNFVDGQRFHTYVFFFFRPGNKLHISQLPSLLALPHCTMQGFKATYVSHSFKFNLIFLADNPRSKKPIAVFAPRQRSVGFSGVFCFIGIRSSRLIEMTSY